ncbi:hypothetical protein FL966_11805 [Caproiciproducens galactitolivorans]|uniref:hypothetical protein n=1 Tax=Caproiciproducens galactitolivorans TaxID=642589 RepID=UPI00108427E5|nr:hypothetical protein [Caproiciproducens galactitolivorans]QEY35687.1 hypothetical protein FL966_11805 [Caproiciproducens galactitolivorans]
MLAKIPAEGEIVEEYSIGGTRILFCDAAFADNAPDDERRILSQAAQASINILLKGQNRK